MQDYHHNAMFDDRKYYFPPGALDAPRKPEAEAGLEVALQRDEQGTPGLQPVPNEEQKFSNGGLYEGLAPYRTAGAIHADELTSQGIQAVPMQYRPQTPPAVYQAQYQWAAPTGSEHYGEPLQMGSSYEVSSYPHSQPSTYDLQQQPVMWNTEHQQLNPAIPPSPDPSWGKDGNHPRGAAGTNSKRRRGLLWAIGGAVLIIIVVAAVVGGVLGSRKSDSSSSNESSAENKTSSDNTVLTPLLSIKTNSKLAVTGYRTTEDYGIRLFFQDPDQRLRFLDKENTSSNWTESTILDTLPYEPKAGGTIAASTYMSDPPMLTIFYEDKDGIVRGQNFNFEFESGTKPVKGESSSINDYPLPIAEGTRISSYFPFLISQDTDNQVRWTVMHGQDRNNLSAPWWVNDTDLNVEASLGGGMVNLPVIQDFLDDAGLVYRSSEGELSYKIRNETDDADAAWMEGTLAKQIPEDTALAAFVVGRAYDDSKVNTCILYQDDDGTIQVVWQDDGTGWQGPQTYEALDGAVKGTDITCLTPGASDGIGEPLSREQDMNRCFFQVDGGRVKEVWFDGTDWVDVGIVPMA